MITFWIPNTGRCESFDQFIREHFYNAQLGEPYQCQLDVPPPTENQLTNMEQVARSIHIQLETSLHGNERSSVRTSRVQQ